MRAVVQRVTRASVEVNGKIVGAIGQGLLILLGVHEADEEQEAEWLSSKIASLRIFPDETGKMNHSLLDIHGEALVVSQFTLYGKCQKGRRPDFLDAARPEKAKPLYEKVIELLRKQLNHVASGEFGAKMEVSLTNSGPVTLLIESPVNQ